MATAQPRVVEVPFSALEVEKYYPPSFPVERISAVQTTEEMARLEADLKDFKDRVSRPYRISQVPWPLDATHPAGATLTLIEDLMEGSALSFRLPLGATGEARIEIEAPRGPELGAVGLSVEGQRLGSMDLWGPCRTDSRWMDLCSPIYFKKPDCLLRIEQKSALDAPFCLKRIRFTFQ